MERRAARLPPRPPGGTLATKTSRDVLVRGLRVLGRAIREEPRLFAVGVGGSVVYGLLVIGGAFVVGAIVGEVVVPAITTGRVDTGLLAAGAAVLVGLSVLRV